MEIARTNVCRISQICVIVTVYVLPLHLLIG